MAEGVLTIMMGMWHIARRQKDKLKIPYGIAIATAGLWIITTTDWSALNAVSAG